MQIQLSTSSLSDGRWYEYLIRFALGGAATVLTGLINSAFGASIGGLFLALLAIFCASATLIERHEIRCKGDAGDYHHCDKREKSNTHRTVHVSSVAVFQ
jgi:hypothetical protein